MFSVGSPFFPVRAEMPSSLQFNLNDLSRMEELKVAKEVCQRSDGVVAGVVASNRRPKRACIRQRCGH